ncbi:MAG TPA: helix-turn-helix domain-containing protein [Beijerinckiaceae bacterium]|jgi:putative transcriptional regulator
MTRLGDDLIRSAREAVAIARGEADPAAYRVHVPPDIEVKAIRERLGMTQQRFAGAFGFPIQTLRDWEQGRSRPDTSARAYLLVIARAPAAVQEALAADRETTPKRARRA